MDKEKETVWTSDMGFMPPIPKTEGRTICREECQLTEYKQEIERLREAAKDRPKDRPNDAADEIERLREALKQFCDSYQPHLSPERCQHCSEAYWEARAALKEGE